MTMLDQRTEEMPPAPRRRPRWLVLVLVVLLLAGITLYYAFTYVHGAIKPSGEPGPDVSVTIARNIGTEGVARVLDDSDVIKSRKVFTYWTKIEGKGPYLAGTYTLQRNSGYDDVATILQKGPELATQRLVIPEGLTIPQVADRVGKLAGRSAEVFKKVALDESDARVKSPLQPADTKSLEGLLFPSTYEVGEKDDERKILQKMVDATTAVTTRLDVANRAKARNLTPYQELIVASLVEREAKVNADRPLVAQVIYNRLAKNQKLQIDATVIYALGQAGTKTRVVNADLQAPGPYNTYVNTGLPPTPIAGSGEAAIQAALDPAPGSFLYYVVIDKEGRHAFATTPAEHQRNIDKARANGVRD